MNYKYVDYDKEMGNDVLTEYLVQSCCIFMFRKPTMPDFAFERLSRAVKSKWTFITDQNKALIDFHWLKKSPYPTYLSFPQSIVDKAMQAIKGSEELNSKHPVREDLTKVPEEDWNRQFGLNGYAGDWMD